MHLPLTAEKLYQDLRQLPTKERQKFFAILSSEAFPAEPDQSHEQVFGHLETAELTSAEAARYLEVSPSTFRRYLQKGQITPSTTLGRSLLFSAPELRAFKKALKVAKG
jgi:excisionase family DNA binding protein